MTTETSNARGEVVAWFPTYASGEIVRNYGDGSPVYAYKTKEEAEQAKRCHLGATGPVIPLYTAPPPTAARGDVRGLVSLAKRVQYADTHAQVSKDDAGEFICLPPWLWLEIRDAAAEALAAEGVQAGEVDGELSHADLCRLSRVFNDHNELHLPRDRRIKEWLGKRITEYPVGERRGSSHA